MQIDSLMAQRAQLETGLRAKSHANDELTQVCRHRSDSSSILTSNADNIILLTCYAGGRVLTSTPILLSTLADSLLLVASHAFANRSCLIRINQALTKALPRVSLQSRLGWAPG